MSLFTSLADSAILSELPSIETKKPAYPPTAIQLYSTKYIDFLTSTVFNVTHSYSSSANDATSITNSLASSNNDKPLHLPRRFEMLSYQAVQVKDKQQHQQQSTLVASTTTSGSQNHTDPNLGIWDFNFQHNNDTGLMSSFLNKVIQPDSESITFILSLDLDDSTTIYANVTSMIQSIITYYETRERSNMNSEVHGRQTLQGTTSLRQLRQVKFGMPPESDGTDKAQMSSIAESSDGRNDTKISIVICAISPSRSPKTYMDKQAQNLLSYHLRKYAAEINCTLCFVKMDQPSDSDLHHMDGSSSRGEEGNPSEDAVQDSIMGTEGMMVSELTEVIRRVCTEYVSADGIDVKNDIDDERTTKDKQMGVQEEDQNVLSALCAPDCHDVDLINSVLLRNASCPGVWDANKDSLLKAIPSSLTAESTSTKAVSDNANGDEDWLSKLADSVSAFTSNNGLSDGASVMGDSVRSGKTKDSAKKKASKKKAKSDNKDVANFFEDLLKK